MGIYRVFYLFALCTVFHKYTKNILDSERDDFLVWEVPTEKQT